MAGRMRFLTCLMALGSLQSALALITEQPIDLLPAQPAENYTPKHLSGYYTLNATHDVNLFYMFFESRSGSADAPFVLWMTGGPGCSSELAVFYENGPYHIKPDLSLESNQFGWDIAANILFIDQPVGTGFSYTDDDRDYVVDEHGVATDMLNFLQEFMDAHPEHAHREVYITGESYGGHYVPAVSHKVWDFNKRALVGPKLNLKGFAIGNGLTSPAIQFGAYADYAQQNGLISQSAATGLKRTLPLCQFAVRICNEWPLLGFLACPIATTVCQATQIGGVIAAAGTNFNVYDIRKPCVGQLCYDFSRMDKYLAQPEVRAKLGVSPHATWTECSMTVNAAFAADWPLRFDTQIASMLDDGVRVLIYAGVEDFICNWLGNSRWVDAMQVGRGKIEWPSAPETSWAVNGTVAGTVKASGELSFVKIAGAGHMVPMDKPAAALEMISDFLEDTPLPAAPSSSLLKPTGSAVKAHA